MSCMEVLGFVDKRMLEHGDGAVLEYFGTDDGREGESLFKLAGTQERAADSPHLLAFGAVERGTASLTGNAQALLFQFWLRGKAYLGTTRCFALKKRV